jgi:20S proteasome alpha/beta subunit
MLHLINNNPAFVTGNSAAASTRTALVCTGLKGDANWLIRKVRSYSHKVWERYNQFVDAPGAAYAVSKCTRQFWGYDEDSEWQPGLLLADRSSRDQTESSRWGRPLGVVTIILSSSLPYVFVVEPSGVVQRYRAFAMGKRSGEILEKLHKTMNGDAISTSQSRQNDFESDEEDLTERLINLIQETIGSTNKEMNILIEELSEQGVNRTVVPLSRVA